MPKNALTHLMQLQPQITSYFDVHVSQLKFKPMDCQNLQFESCHFKHCDFSGAHLTLSRFNECHFVESKLLGLDWTQARWPEFELSTPLFFKSCRLDDSSFFGLVLDDIAFIDCQLKRVDFTNASCRRTQFINSDCSQARFSNTNLQGSNFTQAFNYQINPIDNLVQKAIFSRSESYGLLAHLNIKLIDD